MDICHGNQVVEEVVKHLPQLSMNNLTINNGITKVILDGKPCERLAATKTVAFRDAAWIIATQKYVENYESDKKEYMDQVKKKYESILNKFSIYVGKLSKIAAKWDKITKQQQGQ